MDIPSPEQRRIKITTDTRPSTISKLAKNLAHAHPFTQQVDLVFPTPDVKEDPFVGLNTRYYRAKVSLSTVIDEAGPYGEFFLKSNGCFTMLSVEDNSDDVWCIDQRGVLTLSVSKLTYERLGLVGKKLPFKGREEQYVVSLNLRDKNTETVGNRSRRTEGLKSWDNRRMQDGHSLWNVLFSVDAAVVNPSVLESALVNSQACEVPPRISRSAEVRIPSPTLSELQLGSSAEDADDCDQTTTALFEWAGLAALRSQRLQANDRVEPYVAVYECPSPSYIGNLSHLQWSGFISPDFIQLVVDAAVKEVEAASGAQPSRQPLIAIISHAISPSPVAYIPPESKDGTARDPPMHLARPDGEDTWCLLLTPGLEAGSVESVLAESIGQYDTRWG